MAASWAKRGQKVGRLYVLDDAGASPKRGVGQETPDTTDVRCPLPAAFLESASPPVRRADAASTQRDSCPQTRAVLLCASVIRIQHRMTHPWRLTASIR
jgi:hypothetical protein